MGLGTQDTFEEAQAFAAEHGLTFDMVWDPTFESWRFYEVFGQPSYVLVGADGLVRDRGFGMFPDDVTEGL